VQHPSGFNWFDICLIVVLLWSALAGLRAGLARVVVGIAAVVTGFLAGFWFYDVVAAAILPWVHDLTIANILGFFIIFFGALIAGAFLAAVLSRIFQWIGLSWLNHAMGGVVGFLRGALIIAVFAGILVAFSPSPTPSFIQNSQVLPYAGQIAWWLVDLAPRDLRDAFTQQMQNLRQFWNRPPAKQAQTASGEKL
jgi:membrane protein required for colicin V production